MDKCQSDTFFFTAEDHSIDTEEIIVQQRTNARKTLFIFLTTEDHNIDTEEIIVQQRTNARTTHFSWGRNSQHRHGDHSTATDECKNKIFFSGKIS